MQPITLMVLKAQHPVKKQPIYIHFPIINNIINPVRIQNKKMKTHFSSDPKGTNLGNYTVLYNQLLGKGTTGTVYRGIHNQTHAPVAVKVIDLSTIKDDATRSLLENEKMALQTVRHGNVVKLLDVLERDGCCFIVTELCEGETLKDMLSRKGKLSEGEAMAIFRKVLSGCLAIVQNCVIHRDLKPANIIVSPSLQPKIIDFGFCEVIMAKKVMRTFNVGSPSYMAPEAYLKTLYSEKSDSWSLGMMLFEMLFGRTLDEGQVIRQYFDLLKKEPHYIGQYIEHYSGNVREILQKSLKYLPEERMSISSMKYAADVYHLHRSKQESRQEDTQRYGLSHSNGFNLQSSMAKIKNSQATCQTLHNISGEALNRTSREGGFVSFADFNKPYQTIRSSKVSQVSISDSSNKNSTFQHSFSGKMNENQHQLLTSKLNGIGMASFQCLSSKDLLTQRPKGPPVYRQVTVRYL